MGTLVAQMEEIHAVAIAVGVVGVAVFAVLVALTIMAFNRCK